MTTSQPGADARRDEHEIRSERRFPVPRDALFGAFADPVILASWWGPRGSVNVFETFDLRPGGTWKFVMRSADGRAYTMTNEFLEIAAPERVLVRHLQAGHGFDLHMHYEAVGPTWTRLRWCMRFDDADEATRVRPFVVEANEENFDRLEIALGLPPGRTPRVEPPAA